MDKATLHISRASSRHVSEQDRQQECQLAIDEARKLYDDSHWMRAKVLAARAHSLKGEHDESLKALGEVAQQMDAAVERGDRYEAVVEDCRIAMEQGNEDEADQLLKQAQATGAQGVQNASARVALDMSIAEAYMEAERWKDGLAMYKALFVGMDLNSMRPPAQREVIMGLSRCLYEVGEYKKSIGLGCAAIEMNRYYPGVHKYVALSQKALGESEATEQTMAEAVIYETPWDEEHQATVLSEWKSMFLQKT